MGQVADMLDRMKIRASSPDGNIEVTVRRGGDFSLAMRSHAYERYHESTLTHQLERLATLAMTGYTRGHRIATGSRGKTTGPTFDRRRREYREALGSIVNTGASASGAVRVRTVGMMNWRVTLGRGTLAHHTEAEFLQQVEQAVGGLVHDNRVQVAGLKERYFGLDMSAGLKTAIRETAPGASD